MAIEPGHKALEALDRVLAQQPHKDGKALTAVTMCLTQFREALIAGQQGQRGDEAPHLDQVNAIISVVLAAHFPLGQVPWDELRQARGELSSLVQAAE